MSKRTSLYTWCKTNHKENIIKEWDFSKNESLGFDVNKISCSSGKKVWWICPNGHNWQAMVSNRIREDAGCPYCSNKKVLKGYNDLATTNPKLASEWNYKKNGFLTPFDITLGSHKRVWWVCSKGHEWLTSVCNRKRNDGCPYCSNKKYKSDITI